jgi:hypothetical protein
MPTLARYLASTTTIFKMATKSPEKTEDLTEEAIAYTPSTDEIVAALATPESIESRLTSLIERFESAIVALEKKAEAK